MTDKEKISLAKKIINGAFEAGMETADEFSITMICILSVLDYEGDEEND